MGRPSDKYRYNRSCDRQIKDCWSLLPSCARNGRAGRCRALRYGFRYYRHGTLSLYAAPNVKTGLVENKNGVPPSLVMWVRPHLQHQRPLPSRRRNLRLLWLTTRFVILHLGVDRPDVVLVRPPLDDVVDRRHGRQHRVVLVVVLVHPVSADQEKIVELVHELANRWEPVVGAEICRIRLL